MSLWSFGTKEIISDSLYSYTDKLQHEFMRQEERILLDQLGDLLSRGLLVIESTSPVLIQTDRPDGGYNLKLERSVRLTLKDMEYIKKIEDENQELKARLKHIEAAMAGQYK